jgi:sugar lactone lactonase YvrE
MVRPWWVRAIPRGIATSIVSVASALPFVSCTTPSHPPAEGDVYVDASTFVAWDARVADATLATKSKDAQPDSMTDSSSDAFPEASDGWVEGGDEWTESAAPSDGGLTTDASDASDAPIDDLDSQGPACDAGLSLCSLGCVDTKSNNLNCGQCDNACSTGFSCMDASCECSEGTTLCNQQCANLVSDQANCGACGHNCEGSSCVAGLCQPTVVAAPNAVIGGIAVTATTMYFTASGQSGAIESKAFSGTANPTALVLPEVGTSWAPFDDPRGVAVDSVSVYWVNYGSGAVMSFRLTDSPGDAPTTLWDGGAATARGPLAVAIDTSSIFWVSSIDGKVFSMPLAGAILPTIISSGEDQPVAITVDSTNVYWVDRGSRPDAGAIKQASKMAGADGGVNVLTLASGENLPNGIAVDSTNVYWTDNANPGVVRKVPIGQTTAATIASNQGAPDGVAVDSQYVYWTNWDGNTVMRMSVSPQPGDTPFVLATNQNNPDAIVVDAKNVYWVSQGSHSISFVAK